MVVSLLNQFRRGRVPAGECVVMAVMVMLLLLAGFAESNRMRYSKQKEVESKYLMMDPSANYEYFVKVGDMTFMKPEFEEKYGNARSKRLTSTNTRLWEGGVVQFEISTEYSESERNKILFALSHIEEHTCIRFNELRDPDTKEYLMFYKGAGCQSFVGKSTVQPQGVSLASSCIRENQKIVHEICHALGLFHEHQRPDRDDYVDVLYENIQAGVRDQFEILDAEIADTLGVGYDYNSIMHYNSDTFGDDINTSGITIVANQPNITVGSTDYLSKLDIVKLNRLYQCPDTDEHPPRSTIYKELPLPPLPPCGKRFIDVMEGSISSEDFPTEHLQQHNCMTAEWQISVPEGFQLTLLFDDSVQLGSDCSDSYVEIYNNLDCTGYGTIICSDPYYLDYYTLNTACVRYHPGSNSNDNNNSNNNNNRFGITFAAEDVNECCDRCGDVCEFECVNTYGSYYCVCPEGYFQSPSGPHCLDVNECALMENNMCDYKCVNYGGGYECFCPDGRPQEKGVPCSGTLTVLNPQTQPAPECILRVNECETNNGGCAHLCTNTESSYICTCMNGYQLQEDGHSCLPIMEPLEVVAPALPIVVQPQTAIEAQCPIVSLPPLPTCSTVLRESSGVFSSRNWPLTYNNNEQCDWVVILPDCTKKVRIEFEAFSVAGQMPECPKDQVYVRNGLDEGSYVGLYCSLEVPEPVVIDSHIARITMVSGSEHGVLRLGFTATYQAVDE